MSDTRKLANLIRRGYIDITGLDVEKIVVLCFQMSRQPEGTITPPDHGGPITPDELARVMATGNGTDLLVHCTFLRGRMLNLTIARVAGRVLWRAGWFNHTDQQQIAVLERVGLPDAVKAFEAAKEMQTR